MAKQKASTAIFINRHHPNTRGLCPVSIRVTFLRKKRYYPTPIHLSIEDFDKALGLKPRGEYKVIALRLHAYERKAAEIVERLPIFSWELFEKHYLINRNVRGSLDSAFEDIIKSLTLQGRVGTAQAYECSRNSLKAFSSKATFADVTSDFLRRYENWMLCKGRSVTTVGIYLRNLRALFNNAIGEGLLSSDLYPFGKRRYEIPMGNNVKKALTMNEISQIYHYRPLPGSIDDKVKDFWVFLYLCNGINVKDFCLLKYGNIQGDIIEFERAKTARTKRKVEPIRVSVLDEMRRIIEKWGNQPRERNSYVFPVLAAGLTAEYERDLIKLMTKLINKHMRAIASILGITSDVTTYVARHSFATVMKRSGASTEFIGEALGHSNVRTTQSYLSSFEDEQKEMAKALTNFGFNAIKKASF